MCKDCNELALLLSQAVTRFQAQLERDEIRRADRQRTQRFRREAIELIKKVRETG